MTIPELIIPGVAFKEIIGYPHQLAGDDGSIWSSYLFVNKRRVRAICPHWTRIEPYIYKGYEIVPLLADDGEIRNVGVHRAVLFAFIGPDPGGMHACHWDGNRRNNHLDNLRWDTPEANELDKIRHGVPLFKDLNWQPRVKAADRKRPRKKRRPARTPIVEVRTQPPPTQYPAGSIVERLAKRHAERTAPPQEEPEFLGPTLVPFSEQYRRYVAAKEARKASTT